MIYNITNIGGGIMSNKTIIIDKNTSLGTLVTYFPDCTTKLNDLHIDYCCQGDRTLAQAIKDHNLNDSFIVELNKDYQDYLNRPSKKMNVVDMNNKDLIDLIKEIHHVYERDLWEEITPLLNKIMVVHYEHGKDLLLELHHKFSLLRLELEEHFAKEECEIFPLMIEYSNGNEKDPALKAKVQELISEHETAGDIIKEILELTNHFTLPEYACPTFKATYAKMHELIDDIFLHIAKENSVLFKRFED